MMEDTQDGQTNTDTNEDSTSSETLLTSTDTSTTGASTTGEGNQAAETNSDNKESGSEVPETYLFEMPEGVELDEGLATRAQTTFKELGLTQDQANKLTGMVTEQRLADATDGQNAFKQQLDGWINDIKTDTQLSGTGGADFEANAGIAASAINQFGTPELKEMLNQTGAGNHPEMFRFALAVGRTLKEDNPGAGNPAATSPGTADNMYADTTPATGG
jgi:hypothetical protein